MQEDLWENHEAEDEKLPGYHTVKDWIHSSNRTFAESKIIEYLRVNGFPEKVAKDMLYRITEYMVQNKFHEAIALTLSKPK